MRRGLSRGLYGEIVFFFLFFVQRGRSNGKMRGFFRCCCCCCWNVLLPILLKWRGMKSIVKSVLIRDCRV